MNLAYLPAEIKEQAAGGQCERLKCISLIIRAKRVRFYWFLRCFVVPLQPQEIHCGISTFSAISALANRLLNHDMRNIAVDPGVLIGDCGSVMLVIRKTLKKQ